MITISGHNQKYADAIRQARISGEDAFQNWFNKSSNLGQSIMRGHWDFAIHILTPRVCKFMENPESRTALEIGYGGGRILNAACSFFGRVIGIDIHDEQAAVEEFLKSQGKSNFQLLKTGGTTIDVESGSIDFIYSFIVLQHLPSFDVFVSYVRETSRCLKKGGVAQLYIGKFSKVPHTFRHFLKGYKEIPDAPVNHTSLVVRLGKAKAACAWAGLRVIESGTSYKRVPDGFPATTGGQNYVTVIKG